MLPQEIGEPGTKDIRMVSPVPPPGFRLFEWPQMEWNNSVDVNRDPGLKFVASWSAKIAEEEMSPIPVENSQDSIAVQVGTTDSEAYTPIVLDRRRPIPESSSDGRSTGRARMSSFGPDGGIRTMETLIGPIAVHNGPILKPALGVYTVRI